MQQYTDDHVVTMGDLEHLRKKGSMVLRDIHTIAGHIQILKEAIDNSADESSLITESNTIRIIVVKLKNNYQIIISDEGRGIPLNSLKRALMQPRTSGKDGDAYNETAGVFGFGIKATMAMSKSFTGLTKRPEGYGIVHAKDLECHRHDFYKRKKPSQTGTIIVYKPDPEWMKDCDKFVEDGLPTVVDKCKTISAFLPNCSFEIYLSDQEVTDDIFQQGKLDEIDNKLANWPCVECLLKTDPAGSPFEAFKKINNLKDEEIDTDLQLNKEFDGKLGYDINLVYPGENRNVLKSISVVNRTPIEYPGSYNIYGLYSTIKEKLSNFIEDDDIKDFFLKRFQLPLFGVISVSYKGAVFCGQTKDDFKDRDFLNMYIKSLRKHLEEYDTVFWKSLFDNLSEQIELAFFQYYNRGSGMGKLKNVSGRLWESGRYCPCRSTDPEKIELFITEGDSAGGYVSQVCDKDTQAVFKVRGKILNSVRANISKVRQNDIIQDLETIMGISVGSKDLSTLNFHRIIILTDADADGHHITSLLVSLFYTMNPELLANGYVHVACPPLYKLQMHNKSLYMRNDKDMLDLKVTTVYQNALQIKVKTSSGQNVILQNDDFRSFCWIINRIGEIIERRANHLVIEPLYLELMAFCIEHLDTGSGNPPDVEGIRHTLNLDNVEYESISNALILSFGQIDITIPLSGLVETLKSFILPELEAINWRYIDIEASTLFTDTLRDKHVTVYQLYQLFKELDKIFTIKRHKGLGEMTFDDLLISAVDPGTRTTIEINSLGDVDRMFKLLDVDAETRKSI